MKRKIGSGYEPVSPVYGMWCGLWRVLWDGVRANTTEIPGYKGKSQRPGR